MGVAACELSLCLGVIGKKKEPSPEEQRLRDQLFQETMRTLRLAVDLGFRNVRALQNDPALAPVRPSREFQELLQELARTSSKGK